MPLNEAFDLLSKASQRLNRKLPNPKLLRDYPAAVRLYDILREGNEDLRTLPFVDRRQRLETWYGAAPRPEGP